MEPLEDSPNVRMVVDADHDLPFATSHELGDALIVFKGKIHAIACRLPVRRIHVVKGVCTVVAFCAVQPRQIFNVGARQALPRGREVFLDPQQVDRRAGSGGTERLPGDLAGEGMVLQVEESGGTLDVGEGFGAGHFLPLEDLTRTQRPFELAHKLFQVVLHDSVQRDQVAVDVV